MKDLWTPPIEYWRPLYGGWAKIIPDDYKYFSPFEVIYGGKIFELSLKARGIMVI